MSNTAYIVAGYRTAVGKAPRGSFRFTRPDDLAAAVIKHLVAEVPALDPTRIDDVIVGNAVPEVKAVADWITTSVAEDGVARAIEKFIL